VILKSDVQPAKVPLTAVAEGALLAGLSVNGLNFFITDFIPNPAWRV